MTKILFLVSCCRFCSFRLTEDLTGLPQILAFDWLGRRRENRFVVLGFSCLFTFSQAVKAKVAAPSGKILQLNKRIPRKWWPRQLKIYVREMLHYSVAKKRTKKTKKWKRFEKLWPITSQSLSVLIESYVFSFPGYYSDPI